MTRTIFLPVGYAEAADRIVALVERVVLQIMPHWLSREACQTFIDRLPQTSRKLYEPTRAIIRVAGDVGRAAPFPPASLLCGSGKPFTNAEGAPRVRASAQTDLRSGNCAARSLGADDAGASHAA